MRLCCSSNTGDSGQVHHPCITPRILLSRFLSLLRDCACAVRRFCKTVAGRLATFYVILWFLRETGISPAPIALRTRSFWSRTCERRRAPFTLNIYLVRSDRARRSHVGRGIVNRVGKADRCPRHSWPRRFLRGHLHDDATTLIDYQDIEKRKLRSILVDRLTFAARIVVALVVCQQLRFSPPPNESATGISSAKRLLSVFFFHFPLCPFTIEITNRELLT